MEDLKIVSALGAFFNFEKIIFMSRYSYTWEKLHGAVYALAGWGPPHLRMEAAAICMHVLQSKDFPEDLQEEWNQLWSDFTSGEPEGDEGRIQATLRSLNESSYRELAGKIISLYDGICRQRIVLAQN